MTSIKSVAGSLLNAFLSCEPVSQKGEGSNDINRDLFEVRNAHQISDCLWKLFTANPKKTGVFEDDVAMLMALLSKESAHIQRRKNQELQWLSDMEINLTKKIKENASDTEAKTKLENVRAALEQARKDLQSAVQQTMQETQILSQMNGQSHQHIIDMFRNNGV